LSELRLTGWVIAAVRVDGRQRPFCPMPFADSETGRGFVLCAGGYYTGPEILTHQRTFMRVAIVPIAALLTHSSDAPNALQGPMNSGRLNMIGPRRRSRRRSPMPTSASLCLS
jgi:hypothetical protein